MTASTSPPANDKFALQRGNYTKNWAATLILVVYRLVTIPLQYKILTSNPFSLNPPPRNGDGGVSTIPTSLTTFFGLFPHLPMTAPEALLLFMVSYISLKHVVWATCLHREAMTLPFVTFFAGPADLVFESVTSLVFTTRSNNPLWSPWLVYIGVLFNITGLTAELVAEAQRARFKQDPRNRGKVYTGGLFGIVRNVGYACNLLFSFGYALGAGGPVYACMYSGIYVMNFVFNAIPGLEKYMEWRYREKWELATKEVPWRLCPGVY